MIRVDNTESKKETRSLKCLLLNSEKLQKAEELAIVTQQLAQLEEEKNEIVDRMKSRITEATARQSLLASVVASGYEYRPVDCEIRKDFDAKRLETTRLDSGEVIESRPLLENELQRSLPLSESSKR